MIAIANLFEQEDNQDKLYKVPMIEKKKIHKLNTRTNRMKNFKTVKYLFTDIPPEKRTFKNRPRYANGDPKVKIQDWLEIDAKKLNPADSVTSWGWASNGKCYGWSHRAIYGFGIGDVVTSDICGNESKKEYTIKTKEQAEQAAKDFARDVS